MYSYVTGLPMANSAVTAETCIYGRWLIGSNCKVTRSAGLSGRSYDELRNSPIEVVSANPGPLSVPPSMPGFTVPSDFADPR